MQAGCQLQGQCDPSAVTVGAAGAVTQAFAPGAGIYDGVWESSPIDGTWMSFPQERTYTIYPKLPDGGPLVGPYILFANVSPDPDNYTTSGSNYAGGAGNIAEFTQSADLDGGRTDHFQVTNETCSPYYLWIQATPQYAAVVGTADAPDASDAGAD
jgi:hypothetical protein